MVGPHRAQLARSAWGVALAACLWAPVATAEAAPCSPSETSGVTLTTEEKGDKAPLVATHSATVRAEVLGSSGGESISVPQGVRVIARNSSGIALVVPSTTSLPVTVSWQQERTDGTQCSASRTTALPVKPSHHARARHIGNSKLASAGGYKTFVVIPTQKDPNLDPLEVSIRVTASARFPSSNAKPRKMTVPMRVDDQIKYRKRLPNLAYATPRVKCKVFLLSCGLIVTEVSRLALDFEALEKGIEKPALDRANHSLLARTQPFREAARYGVDIGVYGGPSQRRKRGYDVQVRQSGRMVGRLRRAERCRSVQKLGSSRFLCRAVRESTKLN